MRDSLSYGIGILFSLTVHGLVLWALVIGWQPMTQQVVIQPQYIEAKLVQLAPKKKVVKNLKKPSSNAAQKKREKQKRLENEKRKEQARKERRRKAEDDRKEQERLTAEKKRLEEAERQRQLIETEFADAIAAEQSLINAQEDEIAANSYRQLIQRRLSENWNRPPSARREMETTIRLQLVPTGRIVGVTVLKSSGDAAFDRSVEQAAFKAGQFIELQSMSPVLFEKKFRQVDVAFSPQDLRL
ncbi:MAG TPA: cell envelope integrity protein TolA [Porticoccaceae bacterium]|nr:cell envelope integrity protein TolA [Porticoccaceae bacterium]HIG67971.1 cell envelope integrity protein TolA [Porticoccaceae bacterium]